MSTVNFVVADSLAITEDPRFLESATAACVAALAKHLPQVIRTLPPARRALLTCPSSVPGAQRELEEIV